MSNTQIDASYELSNDVSIHLAFPDSSTLALKNDAQRRGFEVHSISFDNCVTLDDFFTRISDEFEFPTKAVNEPGAIDWLGNLEWRDSTKFVFIIENVDQLAELNPGAFRGLMDMLPYALDMQRSGGTSFHVFVTDTSKDIIDRALYDLNDANNSLEADDSTINPSHPVRIIIHTNHEP